MSRAAAYTLIKTSAGNSPSWASMPVPFWINQAGSPQIANGSEFVAVQSAFQTWQNVSMANVAFQYKGTTPVSTVGQDGLNVVTFVDSSVPMGLETIAATFSFLTVDPTGLLTIQEADIALSSVIGFSTSGESDKYDIQSVVTHEVGHLLGLDHSALLSSVMTPFSTLGQLDQRTLSYDDMAGVALLYPQNSNSSTLSGISGNVTLAGNGVFGAHVVAVDANGSVAASTISNPDGSYEIDFQTPGSYRLYAEPLDGPVTEQNIGGTATSFYTGLETDFGTTYFGDVSDLGHASAVQIFAGRLSSGRNIHLLPPGSLNLTAPFTYAVHIAAGGVLTLNVGGSNIASGDTFSASDPGITVGNPVYAATTPPGAALPITVAATVVPGPKTIAVTSGGSTSVLSGGVVIVNPQPSNILVAPASGSVDGGTGVSITGQNFRAGAQVYFSGLAATNVQVVNSTTIQAVTPANSPGSANVVVVNSDGTWGLQTNGFSYTGVPPTLTGVSPLSGPPSTIVIINGTEFSSRISDMDVRFNGVPANVASTSRTSVTVLVPFAATTGPITVTVGGNTVTGPSFTVTAPTPSTNLAFTTTPFIDATAGGTALSFGNNDDASALITLPFTFTLFDKTYMAGSQVGVSTNGWISLDGFTQPQFQSGLLPGSTLPPALIAPFFTDLFLPGGSSVYVQIVGSVPNRQLVVEWLNAGILDQQGNDLGSSITFEAVLYEGSNDIQFIYGSMNGTASDGSTATIGIQNSSRTQAVQTGYKQSIVSSGTVIGYHFTNGTYVPLSAPPPLVTDTPYSIPNLGGFSMITNGSGATTSIGFATVQPAAGNTAPSGVAIFGYTIGGVLVSEAGVPAAPPLLSGRIYAEVGSVVDTGVAIANPNSVAASISFHFTDSTGADSGSGTVSIPANGHLAQFLNESSFNAPGTFQGSFTFSSSVPVGVIALRRFNNELGASLLSTLPVTDLSAPVPNTTVVIPHFADGAGWTTQVILVNPTSTAMTGSIQFASPGGQTISTSSYSIQQNSSFKLVTPGTASTVQTGSIQVIPDTGSMTPTSVAIFTNRPGGVTVSEAAVLPATGTALRMYVEDAGVVGAVGSIRSGVAFANTTSTAVTVNISLTDLTGVSLGTTSMNLPANGQAAKFIDELFPGVSTPLKGVLRLGTSGSPIAVAELRGHYNQLDNFLMSTTPPTDENAAAPTAALVFPQIANGGGFTTQFILFSGAAGQSASGDLKLIYEN